MEGLGIDIVEVARFDKYANNLESRFCKRVFTQYELDYLSTKGQASMAGLFAAKEAVSKALGTGFSGFFPNEIEIKHDSKGAPYVNLQGITKQLADGSKILVSISHTKTLAVAAAIKLNQQTN